MIENLRPEQTYRAHVAQAAFITAERLDVARHRQNISNKIAARRQIPLSDVPTIYRTPLATAPRPPGRQPGTPDCYANRTRQNDTY